MVCAVVLLGYCTQIAGASPPPPEYRASYLLPNPDDPYYNQSVNTGFRVCHPVNNNNTFPDFPELSPYRALGNYTFEKTGDMYISEIWYFNNGSSFASGREELMRYLQEHGKTTPVILDISGELARTGDPYIAGLHATRINATAYEAADTSGYFIQVSSHFFSTDNYYIAYYGTAERSGLDAATPQIRTLVMTCIPGFVEKTKHTFDPVLPENPAASLPGVFAVFSVCCTVVMVVLQKKRFS